MSRYYTTAELAEERKTSPHVIRRIRKQLGIGEAWGGSTGYRFSEEDRDAIAAAMKPAPAPARRRRRRAA